MFQSTWLTGCLLACALPVAGGTVTGRVFIDGNGNGRFDSGEKAVANCIVSDEHTQTRTDGEGRYRLELSASAATVFVVNPAGTWPAGQWWAPVSPAKNATADFALRADRQEGVLHFVHGTDPHFSPAAAGGYHKYIEHVNKLPVNVRFVVHTGDLVTDAQGATPAEARGMFAQYTEASRALKPDLRSILGTHDLAGLKNAKVAATEPGYGKGVFREKIGPATYAFRWGPYHFIALDANTVTGRETRGALTAESATWAANYVAALATNEPIVLLTHTPLFSEQDGWRIPDDPVLRTNETRLRAALTGHKLFFTAAGQTHNRMSVGWGGAPHMSGGAISYAWHGERPFPANPHGYVLYRLEELKMERLVLDWAEEVSIDVRAPDTDTILLGRQAVNGVIPDFAGKLDAVEVSVATSRGTAKLAPLGHMAKAFAAEVDITGIEDGIYDLIVKAKFGGREFTERQPVIVYNALSRNLPAKAPAKLSLRIDGALPKGGRLVVNGKPLGTFPADTLASRTLNFEVPANRLRRLNEIAVTVNHRPPVPELLVAQVILEVDGKKHRDPRYSPDTQLAILPQRSSDSGGITSYIDTTYADWAWPVK